MTVNTISEDDGLLGDDRRDGAGSNEARMQTLETKLDQILVQLDTLSAGTALKPPATPERRKTDAKFTALVDRIENLATRFDRFETSLDGLTPNAPAQTDAASPDLLQRLEALQAQLEAAAPAREGSRPNALFEAEKIGFERLLTGFRLVLRDLAQQVQARPVENADPVSQDEPNSALSDALQSIAAQVSGVNSAVMQLGERMDRFETVLGSLSAGSQSTRPNVRFEAEKVGFERLLTGFRLVLRDFADAQLGQGSIERQSDSGVDATVDKDKTDHVLARLEAMATQLSGIDTAGQRDAIDALAARIDEIAGVIAAGPSPAPVQRPTAMFEAEKIGFTRLLTGFRLVLQDLADRVQTLEIASPSASTEGQALASAGVSTVADTGAPATEPVRVAADISPIPEFDPRKLDLIHVRTALGLVLRHVEQSAGALDRAVARVNETGLLAASTQAVACDPAPILERLDALEARLSDLHPTSRPLASSAQSRALSDADIIRADNAIEPLSKSLRSLLAGYRFILAGLQRESADLQKITDRLSAAENVNPVLIAMTNPPAVPPVDAMVKGLRRINALADRLAVTVKTAGDISLAGSNLDAEPGIASDIREQTAEFLAIGSALMAELKRQA